VDIQKLKRSAPWFAVFLFLFLPMYAITAAVVVRSGVFSFNGKALNADQYKTFWAFIGAALGSTATILGLLFTRSHNQRTLAFQEDIENRKLVAQSEVNERNAVLQGDAEARLNLDTVVKGLELIVNSDGQYAPKAKIAGALAALVHLGHPIIAMRTLSAIWEDDRIDSGTAAWLISEVFREGVKEGSGASMIEASGLLQNNVPKLCSNRSKGNFEWPDTISEAWPQHIPIDARITNLQSIIMLLLSQERDWWEAGGGYGWFLLILDEIRRSDNEDLLRNSAARLLKPLATTYPRQEVLWTWQGGMRKVKDIRTDAESHPVGGPIISKVYAFIPRIEAWVEGKKQDIPMEDSGTVGPAELPH
jgi:hypothetical protein